MRTTPARRSCGLDEVARVVAWLASEEAGWFNTDGNFMAAVKDTIETKDLAGHVTLDESVLSLDTHEMKALLRVAPPMKEGLTQGEIAIEASKTQLRSVPEALFRLRPSLTTLSFGGCKELTELPLSVGDLRSLTELSLGGCSLLAVVPESTYM